MSFAELMLPAPRAGGFRMDGYWVWDGSVIKGDDGRYHLFSVRWPNDQPMHPSWLLRSEIVRAVADTPEGPYAFAEVVFESRGAEYWDGRSTFNPQIIKHGDTYVLFYVGTTHPFPDIEPGDDPVAHEDDRVVVARSNKRIGIATATSVTGPFKRRDAPVLLPRPDKFDNFFTSNPAPLIHEDGSVLLVYKTRSYAERPYPRFLHGEVMALGVATAPHYLGPYTTRLDEPMFPTDRFNLEDPFLFRGPDGYELIAKDMTGNICGEYHAGMHAHSTDGFHWVADEGQKAYTRTIRWDDGTEQVMGSLERPFVLFEHGRPTHMLFATGDGPGEFMNATQTWNMVVPLRGTTMNFPT
ncbi:MAG TPA: glycoside hydrolase family protein [Candidatus Lumbricidophila sp.]|nr:glycoside hydrolase family protein [Candidatus Lumbricidophila sp.]